MPKTLEKPELKPNEASAAGTPFLADPLESALANLVVDGSRKAAAQQGAQPRMKRLNGVTREQIRQGVPLRASQVLQWFGENTIVMAQVDDLLPYQGLKPRHNVDCFHEVPFLVLEITNGGKELDLILQGFLLDLTFRNGLDRHFEPVPAEELDMRRVALNWRETKIPVTIPSAKVPHHHAYGRTWTRVEINGQKHLMPCDESIEVWPVFFEAIRQLVG